MRRTKASWTLIASDATLVLMLLPFTPLTTAVGIPWVGYDWDNWHGFVAPHLVLSACLVIAAAWNPTTESAESTARQVIGWMQPFLAATFIWAMRQWPGGDDGGGMAWLLCVGPVTALTLVVGSIVAAARIATESWVALMARRVFSIAIAAGFAIWATLPWLDIAFSR